MLVIWKTLYLFYSFECIGTVCYLVTVRLLCRGYFMQDISCEHITLYKTLFLPVYCNNEYYLQGIILVIL